MQNPQQVPPRTNTPGWAKVALGCTAVGCGGPIALFLVMFVIKLISPDKPSSTAPTPTVEASRAPQPKQAAGQPGQAAPPVKPVTQHEQEAKLQAAVRRLSAIRSSVAAANALNQLKGSKASFTQAGGIDMVDYDLLAKLVQPDYHPQLDDHYNYWKWLQSGAVKEVVEHLKPVKSLTPDDLSLLVEKSTVVLSEPYLAVICPSLRKAPVLKEQGKQQSYIGGDLNGWLVIVDTAKMQPVARGPFTAHSSPHLSVHTSHEYEALFDDLQQQIKTALTKACLALTNGKLTPNFSE